MFAYFSTCRYGLPEEHFLDGFTRFTYLAYLVYYHYYHLDETISSVYIYLKAFATASSQTVDETPKNLIACPPT